MSVSLKLPKTLNILWNLYDVIGIYNIREFSFPVSFYWTLNTTKVTNSLFVRLIEKGKELPTKTCDFITFRNLGDSRISHCRKTTFPITNLVTEGLTDLQSLSGPSRKIFVFDRSKMSLLIQTPPQGFRRNKIFLRGSYDDPKS